MGLNLYLLFYFLIMADEIKKFITSDGEYDRTKLLDTVYKNAENYSNYRKNKQQSFDVNAFNAALSDITEAIENGTLSRGAGRKYTYNGDGQLNTAAHAAALDLIDRTLTVLPRIPKADAEKYQSNVLDRFNKRFYGGNFKGTEDDLLPWKQGVYTAESLASIFDDEANDLELSKNKGVEYDFEGSAYYNYEDAISKNRKLAQNLRDGKIDTSDLADWVATGGDASTFRKLMGLTAPRENAVEKEWKEREQMLRDLEVSDEEIQKRRAQFYELKRFEQNKPYYALDYNEKWNAFAKQHFTGKGESDLANLGVDKIDLTDWNGEKTNEANNKPSWLEREGNADYADRLYKHALSGTYYEGAKDGYTNSQILRLYMAEQLAKDPDQFLKIDDNNVLISSTIDLNTGTAVKFNTDTNKFTKIHVDPQSTPILLAELKKKYQELNPYLVHSGDYVWGSFAKNGGKLNQLKALKRGGNIQYALSGAELAKLKKEEREGKYEQSVIDRALQKGVSEDAIRLGDKAASTDDSTNSLIRNISTGLDVAGGVASFIPVIGNAAGAILGTVGTVGNLVADAMDDSVSSEEMWTNLGINAGLTGLMLIPGGGSASLAGKALKAGKTLVQTGMVGYAGYNVANNWDRIKELRKKADEGTLSHEERRELNMYYSMASGAVTGTKGLAGQVAPKLGNNWAGKTAATIADPLTAIGAATKNKKASAVFRDMVRNTKPVMSTAEGKAKGELFEYTDANGKVWQITGDQRKAMIKAESEGRAAGLSGKDLDQKIGDAWANSHPEKTTKNIVYSTADREVLKTWETADPAIQAAMRASVTDDGLQIGNIKFSKNSAEILQKTYKDAIDAIPDTDPRLVGKTTAEIDVIKHQAGMDAAKVKFAELAEAKEVKVGEILGPVFGSGNTSTISKWFNKLGVRKSGLDMEDLGQSSFERWANSGEGYRFDQNTAVGRGNLRMRMRQRQHAHDYLANGLFRVGLGDKGADFLLNKFNTNWELGQGMSAFRTRTDELLDANAQRRAFQNSDKGKAQIARQERRQARHERRAQYEQQLKQFESSKEGKILLQDLEQQLGRPLTEIDKLKLLFKHNNRQLTRAQDYLLFKNSMDGRKVLTDLDLTLGRPATIHEQMAAMRKYQRSTYNRSASLLRKYDVDYSKDIDKLRTNKTFARMSDDDIIDKFLIAQDNGYTGSLIDYPKYLAQQQADIKAATGKKPTINQIWQQEKINSAHTKYEGLFSDTRKAVELARKKYNMKGTDEAILQNLQKDINMTVKQQIEGDLVRIDKVRAFKQTLHKGDQYNESNVKLIQNFKTQHPSLNKTLSKDDLILAAIKQREQNKQVVDSYIAKTSDLSDTQLRALNDQIDSGKRISEPDLDKLVKSIKSSEEADLKLKARRSEVESIFTRDTPEGRKFIQMFEKQYKALSPTLTPEQKKAEAWKIRQKIYDDYIAREDAKAAKLDAETKNYERLLDLEEKRKARAEAAEMKKRDFDARMKEIDDFADEYNLTSSQRSMLKTKGLPLPDSELTRQAKLYALKEGISIEQAKELIIQKREVEYQNRLDNYRKSTKSKTQLADEKKSADKEAYDTSIENYKRLAYEQNWKDLETKNALTSKDNSINSKFTKALEDLIARNKHLSDAGVTLSTLRHFFTSMKGAGKSYVDIVYMLENPNVLKHLTPISRHGSKLVQIKDLRRNFTIDNSQTSNGLSYLKNGGVLKGENGLTAPEWYKKLYKQHKLDNWNSSLNSDYAGSLNDSDWHKIGADIVQAYKHNDAYTGSGHVTEDIQTYFDTTNHNSIDDFIADYNNKIKTIDDRWKVNQKYNSRGAKEGNQAYKQLFSSALNNNNIYYLGYNDKLDDIYGSTTWLRRADKYEKELSDLTEDELKNRTHIIKDKGGKEWIVYKNADGTITRTITNDQSSNGNNGSLKGDGGGAVDPTRQGINWEQIQSAINTNIPDGLSAIRLFKNFTNNKRVEELQKLKRPVYQNQLIGHENIYGDFQALQSAQNSSNKLMSSAYAASSLYNNPEYAGAMLLDAQLKANEIERLGKQTDASAIKESSDKSELAEKERYAKNAEIEYNNRVRSNAKLSADIDATMGRYSADTTNFNTWLSEQEQRFRQKNLSDEELNRKLAINDFEQWWKDNVTDTPEIQAKKQEYYDSGDSKILNEIKKLQQTNARIHSATRFQRLRDIMKGNYWSKLKPGTSDFYVQLKKGGKVDNSKIKRRSEDLRELRKQIRHSITTNQKALDNLSKATLLELKKMMDL